MIGYASLTTNVRNRAALRDAGWRLMISAVKIRLPHGMRYALDNGAWTAHCNGSPFNQSAFGQAIERLGPGADFIVLPDIVAGGMASLAFSLPWRERLHGIAPLLLPVQDGMTMPDIQPLVGPQLGIFVGGTTQWKLASLPVWGRLAAARMCWLHVGRVNTARRIQLCAAAGATSFDGSSASRYATTLPLLDNAARQPDFRF